MSHLNRPDRSFLQYDEVYKYFILCKMFKVICDGKHLHFVNKMDQHSIAHIYETRSNVGNCFTSPLYLKSKFENSFIYRGIKVRNNIPSHLKQLNNVRKFKKHMQSYLLSLPNDPDICTPYKVRFVYLM